VELRPAEADKENAPSAFNRVDDLAAAARRKYVLRFGDNKAGACLHSSTFRLNLSAFCGIGVPVGVVEEVFRRCQGVLRSIRGCSGCVLCQKQLRLS
jgi:hypothetical protein